MLALTRRTLMGSLPALALLTQVGHSETVQPAILQNDIWFQPGVRDIADRLRRELLTGSASRHFIGAYETANTTRQTLQTCFTMELAYDGIMPAEAEDWIRTSILTDLTTDLKEHRARFTRDRPISLVALDGIRVINIWTFQPELHFYIDWNVS